MDPTQHPQHGSQQADFHPGPIQFQLMKTPVLHQNMTLTHCTTTIPKPWLVMHSITDLPRLTGRSLPLHHCPLRESSFRKGTNLWYVLPLFTVVVIDHFIKCSSHKSSNFIPPCISRHKCFVISVDNAFLWFIDTLNHLGSYKWPIFNTWHTNCCEMLFCQYLAIVYWAFEWWSNVFCWLLVLL